MSFSVNDVTLGGYIGTIKTDESDPTNVRVKLNVKVQYKKDEEKDRNWFTCYASGNTAKLILQYYKVGDPIQFKAFLTATPKENGVFTYLTISKLIFLPRIKAEGNSNSNGYQNPQPQGGFNSSSAQKGNYQPPMDDDDIPF
jgi:single-stranded DNA-binding protein